MFCYEVPKEYYEYRSKEMKKRGEEYVFITAIRDNTESLDKYN